MAERLVAVEFWYGRWDIPPSAYACVGDSPTLRMGRLDAVEFGTVDGTCRHQLTHMLGILPPCEWNRWLLWSSVWSTGHTAISLRMRRGCPALQMEWLTRKGRLTTAVRTDHPRSGEGDMWTRRHPARLLQAVTHGHVRDWPPTPAGNGRVHGGMHTQDGRVNAESRTYWTCSHVFLL